MSHRTQITWASGTCILLAWSTLAVAQPSVECKKTETQAECHDRLKCKADEELEDCQKRLRAAGQAGGNGQTNRGNGGARDDGNRGGGDRDSGGNGRDAGGDRGGRDRSSWGRDRDDGGGSRGQRGGGRRAGGHGGFVANKTFGLGLELGEPTGLNGKVFVSDATAIDFGVGYVYDHYYYGDGFHLYGDVLWHPTSLASTPAFELPLYIGGGLRYWDFRYCYLGVCDYAGSAVGIRVPFGIAFDFNNAPVDIFLELVPVLDFLGGAYYTRYGDREHLGIDGSVGVRFWFK